MSAPYTTKIGDAGAAYLKALAMSEDGQRQLTDDPNARLPATFRWHELYEAMQRAAGDPVFDVIQVFESWGEREANLTAVLLDLAIGACLKKLASREMKEFGGAEVMISTADLREISERYVLKRHEDAGSWRISLSPLPEISSEG